MSIWILPATMTLGLIAIIGLAYYITKDLDENGETQEWME